MITQILLIFLFWIWVRNLVVLRVVTQSLSLFLSLIAYLLLYSCIVRFQIWIMSISVVAATLPQLRTAETTSAEVRFFLILRFHWTFIFASVTKNYWQKYVGIVVIYHLFIDSGISGSNIWHSMLAFHEDINALL